MQRPRPSTTPSYHRTRALLFLTASLEVLPGKMDHPSALAREPFNRAACTFTCTVCEALAKGPPKSSLQPHGLGWRVTVARPAGAPQLSTTTPHVVMAFSIDPFFLHHPSSTSNWDLIVMPQNRPSHFCCLVSHCCCSPSLA